MNWVWANKEKTVCNAADESGVAHSRSTADPELAAWLAAGNTPAPMPAPVFAKGQGVSGTQKL